MPSLNERNDFPSLTVSRRRVLQAGLSGAVVGAWARPWSTAASADSADAGLKTSDQLIAGKTAGC